MLAIKSAGKQREHPKVSLRSYIFAAWMPASAVFHTVVFFPLLLNRRGARFVCRQWGKTVLWGLKVLCGLDHVTEGRQNIPTGAALIAAKHQSAWETFSLLVELPNPVFVLKKELINIPFFGWWARAAGYIAIDRTAGASALKSMIEQAQELMKEHVQLVIFPEGSRIPRGQKAKYQPGVAGLYRALGVPCIPVAHNSTLYWHHPSLQRDRGTITLKFLPALPDGLKRGPFLERLQSEIDHQCDVLYGDAPAPEAAAQRPEQH